jgi:DNA-binding transcriptional LysR family regulator
MTAALGTSVLSVNGAALRLNITASAVRYQIALLESRLGTRLFERRGGRLALTPVGASFQRRLERRCANYCGPAKIKAVRQRPP